MVEIVPVDRPDIVEAEFLEQRAAGPEASREFLGELRLVAEEARQPGERPLGEVPEAAIGAAGDEARKMRRHGADRRRDRHVVVVEDDDQPRLQVPGIVHRLVGHAGRHRAVADDGDDAMVAALEVAGDRHAEPGRDRGRGMRRAEGVVLALGAPGEARQPAGLPERPDAVAPAGEDLVGIGLVADVPDQPVVRRVEDVVERHRQLDHAEAGAEMAAGDRDRGDRLARGARRPPDGAAIRRVAGDRPAGGSCRGAASATASSDGGCPKGPEGPAGDRFAGRNGLYQLEMTCKARPARASRAAE